MMGAHDDGCSAHDDDTVPLVRAAAAPGSEGQALRRGRAALVPALLAAALIALAATASAAGLRPRGLRVSAPGTRGTPQQLWGCGRKGEDPNAGDSGKSCCPGLTSTLQDWDGDGRWYYKCMRNEPAASSDTAPPSDSDMQTRPVADQAEGGSTRFMTFNIFWKNRHFDELAALIGRIGPDVAAIEEIPGRGRQAQLVQALRARGLAYGWAPAGNASVNYDGHLLYRTDRFRILESGTVLVDQTQRVPGILRGVHWAAMERTADDVRILVYGAHPSYDRRLPTWMPRDWPAMDVIRSATPQMLKLAARWHAPAVFMCDCNTGNDAPSMKYLEAGTGGIRFQMAATADIDHILIEDYPKSFGTVSKRKVVHPATVGKKRDVWARADHPPVYADVVLAR
mmetsp:Transcript_682/g.1975  ORF Transcript_682/g.1975 Transcript_682/m.1975 type:complete len:397 (-) Transcript_682:42-1232(-)